MGFLDNLGKAAKFVFDTMEEKSNEIQQTKKEFENYSNDKLMQIYKDSSTIKKAVAKKILEERGVI